MLRPVIDQSNLECLWPENREFICPFCNELCEVAFVQKKYYLLNEHDLTYINSVFAYGQVLKKMRAINRNVLGELHDCPKFWIEKSDAKYRLKKMGNPNPTKEDIWIELCRITLKRLTNEKSKQLPHTR